MVKRTGLGKYLATAHGIVWDCLTLLVILELLGLVLWPHWWW